MSENKLAEGISNDKLDTIIANLNSVISGSNVQCILVDSNGNPIDDITNIGGLTDFIVVPYSFGAATNTILAHLNTSYYHVHGQSFVYPDHDDEVLLTSGAGAWNLTGAITEVVPANTLNVAAFDLHWINVSNISDVSTIQIDIFSGAPGSEVRIGATKATRSTNQSRNGPSRIQIPQQLVNTRISCRLSDSTGGSVTCLVSFEGHYYA
jgi:hypothetical protein